MAIRSLYTPLSHVVIYAVDEIFSTPSGYLVHCGTQGLTMVFVFQISEKMLEKIYPGFWTVAESVAVAILLLIVKLP